MDQLRRAIKDALGEDHFSLDYIGFSTGEYTELNDDKQRSVAERNEDVKSIDNPDEIVAKAVRLLESPDWAEVAAGLAVLTGRRVSELLSTAQFQKTTKWSVTFTGALKRRGETQTLSFEIPTLATADRVCQALAKIRHQLPDAAHLSARDINQKYSHKVAAACDRHFDGLVPPRAGGNLYTHLFRAVYATIATFWYCPAHVDAVEFRAAIQGHYQVLDEKNPIHRRSLAASRHYADFDIADSVIAQYHGKRKGIKLGLAGIEPIEPFQPMALQERKRPTRKGKGNLRYYAEDHDRWITVLEAIAPEAKNQSQRTAQLLEWIEAQLAAQQEENTGEPSLEQPQETNEVIAPKDAIESEPIREPETPSLDPTVQLLMQQMAHVMESVAGLTQALTQQRQVAPGPTRLSPKTSTAPLNGSTQPEEQRGPVRPRATSGKSRETINAAIDAIMAHNNMPNRLYDQKWAISINALKEYSKSQYTIQQILTERRDEITAHHAQHQIDSIKHNHRHKGKYKITEIIPLGAKTIG
ncbi:hypothetical protein H6F89_34360 [Cyanobacteria bacterium FACHB-63]|nr:hypothetical protein [Cyanobacteria bacterium FACHB-63]